MAAASLPSSGPLRAPPKNLNPFRRHRHLSDLPTSSSTLRTLSRWPNNGQQPCHQLASLCDSPTTALQLLCSQLLIGVRYCDTRPPLASYVCDTTLTHTPSHRIFVTNDNTRSILAYPFPPWVMAQHTMTITSPAKQTTPTTKFGTKATTPKSEMRKFGKNAIQTKPEMPSEPTQEPQLPHKQPQSIPNIIFCLCPLNFISMDDLNQSKLPVKAPTLDGTQPHEDKEDAMLLTSLERAIKANQGGDPTKDNNERNGDLKDADEFFNDHFDHSEVMDIEGETTTETKDPLAKVPPSIHSRKAAPTKTVDGLKEVPPPQLHRTRQPKPSPGTLRTPLRQSTRSTTTSGTASRQSQPASASRRQTALTVIC
eukprot:scaffold137365_cov50-Attheya_sp.AAC.1